MCNVQIMKGPARKEEAGSKLVPRIDYETKTGKVKRIMSASFSSKSQVPTTYDEAKASCKARKRKERQESISSLCQERKVIRSNSEERPAQKKYIENKNSIRRVSSSEDFQKSASIEKINMSPKRVTPCEKTLAYEDCEHERRRSHERFARPLMLKKKHPNKRLKSKYVTRTKFKPEVSNDNREHKKVIMPQNTRGNEDDTTNAESDSETHFLQLHRGTRERSPSPTTAPVSPFLDLTTLHEQVDCSEPLLSHTTRQINENTETLPSHSIASNRLMSSPRNSIIATHRIYLDPDVPQMTSSLDKSPQNPVDERLQKLTKQINSVKKKIKKYEADFETKHGFKPSHVEKMNDKATKKLYADLGKLKKEQKQLNEVSTKCSLISGIKDETSNTVSLKDTIDEIEKKLIVKRDSANRSYDIEDMTSEQLIDEKVAIQKALLYLESIHGRPNTKEDRNTVRPFYDRYRVLKRMVGKISLSNASGNELATIHENEAMNFITPTSSSQSNDTESEKTAVLPSISTDSDTDTSIGENLHSLSRSELIQQLKMVAEEKKELRRKIKEFEMEIQIKAGKMIQKEDKVPMESVYGAYKKAKAKIKLLEALVGKQN